MKSRQQPTNRAVATPHPLLFGLGVVVLFIVLSITMNTLVVSWKPPSKTVENTQETTPPELKVDYKYANLGDSGSVSQTTAQLDLPVGSRENVEGEAGNSDSQIETPNSVVYIASFSILTNGVTRNFSSPMYWNRDSSAYLTADQPSIIQVAKAGVTWGQFFNTLPFSLSPSCLVTGDQETLCNDDTHRLVFYLNDLEEPNLLQLPIHRHDHAEIVYEVWP